MMFDKVGRSLRLSQKTNQVEVLGNEWKWTKSKLSTVGSFEGGGEIQCSWRWKGGKKGLANDALFRLDLNYKSKMEWKIFSPQRYSILWSPTQWLVTRRINCLKLVGRSYKCQNHCLISRLEQNRNGEGLTIWHNGGKGGRSELDNQNFVPTRSWSLVIVLGWRADYTPFFCSDTFECPVVNMGVEPQV